MTDTPRDRYLAGVDPRHAPLVLALDEAILTARPSLQTRIYYGMLTYALAGDFRHFVCAIDAHASRVTLRFLYGAHLRDAAKVLRHGTSHLSNMDLASLADLDRQIVSEYVSEAVDRHAEHIAHSGAR